MYVAIILVEDDFKTNLQNEWYYLIPFFTKEQLFAKIYELKLSKITDIYLSLEDTDVVHKFNLRSENIKKYHFNENYTYKGNFLKEFNITRSLATYNDNPMYFVLFRRMPMFENYHYYITQTCQSLEQAKLETNNYLKEQNLDKLEFNIEIFKMIESGKKINID